MKTITSLLLFAFCFSLNSGLAQQQPPGIQWQKSLGSFERDLAGNIVNTIDGGFAVVGTVSQASGDVSTKRGYNDIWVTKLNKAGGIEWEKSLGGNLDDEGRDIKVTPDGGYIVIGWTSSTDSFLSPNHGIWDICVYKLDKNGNTQWQRNYGGSKLDEGYSVEVVSDGYMLFGRTVSNDGDVSGNHGDDIVVIKINFSGDIQWQRCYGGSRTEAGSLSYSSCRMRKTNDGAFIFAVSAYSNDGDVSGNHTTFGGTDTWVVKISGSGEIIWQKCYGGSGSDDPGHIVPTSDGGYVISAWAGSTDGDSDPTFYGKMWVFKLNSVGTIQWKKAYGIGGANSTPAGVILQMADGSYLIAAAPSHNGGDVVGNHGYSDCWLVNLDDQGNLKWAKSYGGSREDICMGMILDANEKPVVCAFSQSGDGDIVGTHNPTSGNYANQSDIWLFRLGAINTIKGTVFEDYNANGIKDANEPFADNLLVESYKDSSKISGATKNGFFKNVVDSGKYVTTVKVNPSYYKVIPASITSTFNSSDKSDSINFLIQAISNIRDYRINLFTADRARPGFGMDYTIECTNVGTDTLQNKTVTLVLSSKLNFASAIPAQTSISNRTISWLIPRLAPTEKTFIKVRATVQPPPSVNLGDEIISEASIDSTGDLTPIDNFSKLVQTVRGSYDPNDKTESGGGILTKEEVDNGKDLIYTIRFQNTGNDTAFNVIVRDTLDAKLDFNSVEIVEISHAYNFNIKDGKKLTWTFNNILLPDSNQNEPASHGYIVYRVKPRIGLSIGDTIKNSASIFFDFNLPIATNIERTVVMPEAILPVTLGYFTGISKAKAVELNWRTVTEIKMHSFEVERSADGIDFSKIGFTTANNFQNGSKYSFVDVHPLNSANYYRLKSIDVDGTFKYSKVVLVNFGSANQIISSISPNPSKGQLQLKLEGPIRGKVMVDVIDPTGKRLSRIQLGTVNSNRILYPLNLQGYSKGIYWIRVRIGEQQFMHEVIIQ